MSPVDPANPPLAAIFGLRGKILTSEQAEFFKKANPLGFILFGDNKFNEQNGNIEDLAQISALTKSLKDLMGRDVPILIDQEGGRVARLKPPHWPTWPAAQVMGDLAKTDPEQARRDVDTVNRSIAAELVKLGINVNCAPVLDVAYKETHDIIGSRAFSDDPAIVADLGIAACKAYLDSGIIPVVKHIPGHGRARADSHLELPVVGVSNLTLNQTDMVPYTALLKEKFAKAVWGMVAHVIYNVQDSLRPASCSPKVIDLIRTGWKFDGFLLSDDIVMGALKDFGTMAQRAEKSLDAGCDAVLHCNGNMDEMKQIAKTARVMTPDAIRRFNASIA